MKADYSGGNKNHIENLTAEITCRMINLKSLDIGCNGDLDNPLTNETLRSISIIPYLEKLDLTNCFLGDKRLERGGELPEEMGRMSNLRRLYLRGIPLSSRDIEIVSRNKDLEELYLAKCELINLPESLLQLSNLSKLNLDFNRNLSRKAREIVKRLRSNGVEVSTVYGEL